MAGDDGILLAVCSIKEERYSFLMLTDKYLNRDPTTVMTLDVKCIFNSSLCSPSPSPSPHLLPPKKKFDLTGFVMTLPFFKPDVLWRGTGC
jgi:hypothetical protein